jgi:hypothetical protein
MATGAIPGVRPQQGQAEVTVLDHDPSRDFGPIAQSQAQVLDAGAGFDLEGLPAPIHAHRFVAQNPHRIQMKGADRHQAGAIDDKTGNIDPALAWFASTGAIHQHFGFQNPLDQHHGVLMRGQHFAGCLG